VAALLSVDPKALILVEDKSHPLYDPRVHMPLDSLLTVDIAARMQVLFPIRIRLSESGDQYMVVAGRQRVRCVRWLNETIELGDTQARIYETWPNLDYRSQTRLFEAICEVPGPLAVNALVDEGTMGKSILNSIVENKGKNREGIDSTAAKVCAALREGVELKEIASAMRAAPETVDYLSRFYDLHPDVQHYLRTQNGKAVLIDVFSPLTRDEQAYVIAHVRNSGRRSAKDITELVSALVKHRMLPLPEKRNTQKRAAIRMKQVRQWIEYLEKGFERDSQVSLVLGALRGVQGDWEMARCLMPEELVPPTFRT